MTLLPGIPQPPTGSVKIITFIEAGNSSQELDAVGTDSVGLSKWILTLHVIIRRPILIGRFRVFKSKTSIRNTVEITQKQR